MGMFMFSITIGDTFSSYLKAFAFFMVGGGLQVPERQMSE
jgi:hypothetical protein